MKITTLTATAMILGLGDPAIFAEEPAKPKCEMCEMMKQKAAAQAAQAQQNKEAAAQRSELDQLVTEMNGSLGPKKVEAMAAIVTRLVEQAKAQQGAKAVPQTAPAKPEAHQH